MIIALSTKHKIANGETLDTNVPGLNQEYLINNNTKNLIYVVSPTTGVKQRIDIPQTSKPCGRLVGERIYSENEVLIFIRNINRKENMTNKNDQDKIIYRVPYSDLVNDVVWVKEIELYVCLESNLNKIPDPMTSVNSISKDITSGMFQFVNHFVIGNVPNKYGTGYISVDENNIQRIPVCDLKGLPSVKNGSFRVYHNTMKTFDIINFAKNARYDEFDVTDCVNGIYTSKINPNIRFSFDIYVLAKNLDHDERLKKESFTKDTKNNTNENFNNKKKSSKEEEETEDLNMTNAEINQYVEDSVLNGKVEYETQKIRNKYEKIKKKLKNKKQKIDDMRKREEQLKKDNAYMKSIKEHGAYANEDELRRMKINNEQLKEQATLKKVHNETTKDKIGIAKFVLDVVKIGVALISFIKSPFMWVFNKTLA